MVPIPGTKRERYFAENMAALQVTLSPEEVQELSAVADPSKVVGERYGGSLSKVGGACRARGARVAQAPAALRQVGAARGV